jgi:two-component sensor histidine kinase
MVERDRVEQILRHRATTSKLLESISTIFGNTAAPELDSEIMHTLEVLGEYVGVDRCYLNQFAEDGSTFSTSYEWCKQGIEPHIHTLQNIPITSVPWWMDTLRRYETINIPDLEQMPVEAGIEKEILKGYGIHSVVVVPLVTEYQLVGFLGFETTQVKKGFEEYEVMLLKTIAEIISNALRRANLQIALQQHVRQVEESLEEKNVFLKEIHHRVKNNLQIVSSLLSMQARTIKDPDALIALQNSQSRVRSMSLIHERLYQSQNMGRINFGPYIKDLTAYLFRSYQDRSGQVRLTIAQIEDIALDIDTAIPLGLILNELITNSLKYAFPGNQPGEITVQLLKKPGGFLSLVCSDDGAGFLPEQDLSKINSLGIQLINSLTRQLEGEVEINSSNGTQVTIRIPYKNEPVLADSIQMNNPNEEKL